MTPKIIQYQDLQLEYFVKGTGSQVIVCMHGHGRSAFDFEFLANEDRTLISIHLFHHGNSFFPEERIEENPLSSLEFKVIFELLMKAENLDKFHLLAYSQGGRFTLTILPFFPERILSVQLISPDGMDNDSFYNRTSRKKWARRLFKHWEDEPTRIIRFAAIAKSLKLMRPKVYSFVEKFASDKNTFKRASLTWRGFRMVQPDEKAISKTLQNNPIPFKIIMGTYDQVIRPLQAYAFVKRIHQENAVIEIACGHDFFRDKNRVLLEETLKFN